MKFEDILSGIENGSIKINFMDHKLHSPKTENHWGEYETFNLMKLMRSYKENEKTQKTYEVLKDNLQKSYDKGEIPDEHDKEYVDQFNCYECMIADYYVRMYKEIEIGQCMIVNPELCGIIYFICPECGEKVFPYLYSENEIVFKTPKDLFDTDIQCAAAKSLNYADYFTATINVKEKLGFANYFTFNDGAINTPGHRSDYNINYPLGRNKLMQACAETNVGYCQCDDSCVEVYLSKDHTKIIVADRRQKELDERYEWCGNISLEVWSYRFTDTAVIKEYIENYDDLLENDPDEIGMDYFEVDVKPGKYLIQHNDGGAKDNIWTVISKCD